MNASVAEHALPHAPMMRVILTLPGMLINVPSASIGLKTECHLHVWMCVQQNASTLATLMILTVMYQLFCVRGSQRLLFLKPGLSRSFIS
jgi:hypothetical protein